MCPEAGLEGWLRFCGQRYLVRKHTVAPQFEKNHKMPPSRRDGGLLFLPDLESNPWSSLQTSQED